MIGMDGTSDMYGGDSRGRTATRGAVDSPYEGACLSPATDLPPLFWFP